MLLALHSLFRPGRGVPQLKQIHLVVGVSCRERITEASAATLHQVNKIAGPMLSPNGSSQPCLHVVLVRSKQTPVILTYLMGLPAQGSDSRPAGARARSRGDLPLCKDGNGDDG